MNPLHNAISELLQNYLECGYPLSATQIHQMIPIAYMDKRRDLKTGEVSVVGMSGEVAGKHVIIVDDMIVTGSTMMESAEYLKKVGAISVSVAATHHLYLDGVQEKLEKSEIDEVIVSDTVQMLSDSAVQQVSSKLRVLSVAQLIVDELS